MTRATAFHALAFCVLVCAFAVGCAAPGEPSSRHPVVPDPIADLAGRPVRQRGCLGLLLAFPAEIIDHAKPLQNPQPSKFIDAEAAARKLGGPENRMAYWSIRFPQNVRTPM